MMPSMASGTSELAEQLGGPLPPAIAALDDADQRELAAAVRGARRRQARALSAAAEQSLSHIPFPLRGAVRRAAGL
jgi:hypothetical protein